MGLLDDAIREHLELKRRRGADPSEVERMEQEALGAPQRGEFVEPDAPAAAGPAIYDEPYEPAPDEQPPERPPLPPDADEPPLEPGQTADPWLDEPAEEHEPEPDADALQPTREFAPGEGPEADDVLEETPDFLQETPEHDRLWFEQKPPRDFDLDR
jgi:hypothetical protein